MSGMSFVQHLPIEEEDETGDLFSNRATSVLNSMRAFWFDAAVDKACVEIDGLLMTRGEEAAISSQTIVEAAMQFTVQSVFKCTCQKSEVKCSSRFKLESQKSDDFIIHNISLLFILLSSVWFGLALDVHVMKGRSVD